MKSSNEPVSRDASRLRSVKVVHTAAWAFFASCVVGVPLAVWHDRLGSAAVLIALVAVECLILAFNAWRCPLTGVAARYTDDRRSNFDIYLPEWLARYNKEIFGTLYVVGIAWTLIAWLSPGTT